MRECYRRAARGALPQEHWLGNRPGHWWIRRGARNQISTIKPYSICKDRDESAIDNSKLNYYCIAFVIWLNIIGKSETQKKKSPEVPIFVVTGILEYSCSSRLILQLTKKCKVDNKTRVSIYLIFFFLIVVALVVLGQKISSSEAGTLQDWSTLVLVKIGKGY